MIRDVNELRRLMAQGAITEEDLANMTIAGTSEPQQNALMQILQQDPMPQPRYDIPDVPMNAMRTENGPNAGQVTPLDFRGQQQQQQPMRVAGYGNGIMSDLGSSDQAAPQLDYSRPIEVPGRGKGYYAKDGSGAAYVQAPDGSLTKILLGYDRDASFQQAKRKFDLQKEQADIAQTQAQTANIGSPNYSLTPEGILNSKSGEIRPLVGVSVAQDRKRQDMAYAAGVADLKKDDADLIKAKDLENAFQTWAALQPNVTTGRVAGYLPAIGQPDRQTLEQLQNFLAINNFKPGQGQISNFERTLIKGAGPNVMNDPEVNMDIVKIGLGGVQNMKDRAAFREQYLQARGNLIGADQAWQKYVDANPRYTRDEATKRIVDNPARVGWQQYFGGGEPQPPYVPQGTQTYTPPTQKAGKIELDTPPPASAYRGKIMTTPDGTRYQSDGQRWIRQ